MLHDAIRIIPVQFLCQCYLFFKTVSHFNRMYHGFMDIESDLMTWTQKNTLHFTTMRFKWKTGLFTCCFVLGTSTNSHGRAAVRMRPM